MVGQRQVVGGLAYVPLGATRLKAIPPIATDVTVSWSVCMSVCHTRALC